MPASRPRSIATGSTAMARLGAGLDSSRARTPRPREDSDLDPDSEEERELALPSPSRPQHVQHPQTFTDAPASDAGFQRPAAAAARENGYAPPPPPPPNAPSVRRPLRRWAPLAPFGRPRLLRRRRVVLILLALAILLLLVFQHEVPRRAARGLFGAFRGGGGGGGACAFASVAAAYERDLRRLAKRYPRAKLFRYNAQDAGHRLSATGHVVLDPKARVHPIVQLLHRGEARWAALAARQSSSLKEAVQEYRRRYGRAPPRGFEHWWAYARAHGVLLVDEYDRIEADLAPFRALEREELKRRQREVQGWDEVFNIFVRGGEMEVDLHHGALRWAGSMPRAADQAGMVSAFAEWLPDVAATFSVFDQPSLYLPWGARDALRDAARDGRTVPAGADAAPADDDFAVDFDAVCSPYSVYGAAGREAAALVYDPGEAGNVCSNPELIGLHGLTLEPHTAASHPRPHGRLLPVFSLAKTRVNSDILAVPLDQFSEHAPADSPWEDKAPRLAWRGSNTGMSTMDSSVDWRASHRVRLHLLANNASSAPVPFLAPTATSGGVGYNATSAPGDTLAARWYDMRLAQKPIQCDDDDGTCEQLAALGPDGFQRPEALYGSKFLFDVDGNGWSGRFRRLMATNAAVVKAGIFSEWWQDWLVPWFHYIPAKLDYSDLPSIMAFFAGAPEDPDLNFDETARAIAANGRCFAERMFRRKDIQAYMFRLLLEWARLTNGGGDFDYERWVAEGGQEPK